MAPIEKKVEFGLCTKEAFVAIDDFAFEIGSHTFQFGSGQSTSDVSEFGVR